MNKNYIDILSINDLHGCFAGNKTATLKKSKVPGIVRLGYKVNQIKQENKEITGSYDSTIFVTAGDSFEGTGFSGISRGASLGEVFKALNLKYSALGNHDFDWGSNYIDPGKKKNNKTFEEMTGFKFISNNVIDKQTGKLISWAPEYIIHEANGYRIAFIGTASGATAEVTYKGIKIPNVVNEQGIGDEYEFLDPVECINNTAKDILSKEKVNAIVVIIHEGEGRGRDLISKYVTKLHNIDAIICGHTHEVYVKEPIDADGKKVPIIQAGSNSIALGRTRLEFDNNGKLTNVHCENIMIDPNADLDEMRKNPVYQSDKIFAISDKWEDELKGKLNRVIGHAKRSYIIDFSHGDFNTLCEAGQCVCAILLEAINKNYKHFNIPVKEKYQGKVDCAIWNYGLVRSSINEGEITYGDMYQTLPFDYGLGIVTVKVKDLLILFNEVYNKGHGYGYIQYAGIGVKTDFINNKDNPFVEIYHLEDNKPYGLEEEISFISNTGLISTGGRADHLAVPGVIKDVQLFFDIDSRDLVCDQISLGFNNTGKAQKGILDYTCPKNNIIENK